MLLIFCGTLAIPGRAQNPPAAQPNEPKPVDAPKNEISPGGAPVDPRSYKLGAEDIVGVTVWREPELTRTYTVRPDGKISLLLFGELDAANTTPIDLEARITKAYASILKSPIVSLQVLRVESKKYYISGEIMRSGAFPLVSPTTILQALTMAGGLREFGNPKKIVIMRGTDRLKFNYKDVIKGKNLDQNVFLEPGDHIVIP